MNVIRRSLSAAQACDIQQHVQPADAPASLMARRIFRCRQLTGIAFLLASVSSLPTQALAAPELPVCNTTFGRRLEQRPITAPTPGEAHEAEVGAAILRSETIAVLDDGIRLLADAVFTGRSWGANYTVTIPAGEYRATTAFNIAYPAPEARFRYDRERGDRHGLAKPDISLWLDGAILKAKVNSGLSSSEHNVDGAQFEQLRCIAPEARALRREILYSGASGSVITLLYREFAGDYARPAFSQDLTFDLANGKEIGFRGARIRIDGTSNLGIRYTILKPLD